MKRKLGRSSWCLFQKIVVLQRLETGSVNNPGSLKAPERCIKYNVSMMLGSNRADAIYAGIEKPTENTGEAFYCGSIVWGLSFSVFLFQLHSDTAFFRAGLWSYA